MLKTVEKMLAAPNRPQKVHVWRRNENQPWKD